jgi:TrmH family RNA methyltransferase
VKKMRITSRDNTLLRQARQVRDGKIDELIFVEGLRLAEEALSSGLRIEAVIYSDKFAKKQQATKSINQLVNVARRSATVSEKLLESVSYTTTPQGIVLLAQRPESSVERLQSALDSTSLLVVLHQLNNPVNVGAILRTAEAAGVSGVITTRNTSDPFSPKSLRGAMGSAFRLPIWRDAEYTGVIEWCSARNIQTVCTDSSAALPYTKFKWTSGSALILGPESTGLGYKEIEAADETVSIPMYGEVESLNVSVAAGIVLFEAARQRSSNQ